MTIDDCALCKSHATQVYHSTYKGHPIISGTSWITKTRHYHSGEWQADTLAKIRQIISTVAEQDRLNAGA